MKVVWREWYSEAAIERMSALGTLPREETEIDEDWFDDGEDVAAEIARLANSEDCEAFREGGEIVILEPEEWAGSYTITVDWEPRFDAIKEDL